MEVPALKKFHPTKRITAGDLLAALVPSSQLLGPLTITDRQSFTARNQVDARITVAWGDAVRVRFVVEAKSLNTPLVLRGAINQIRLFTEVDEQPLVIVPFLSPNSLDELEAAKVSGVDLCGNGIVIVPGQIYIRLSGLPNLFPQTHPLNNPYRGRSAMVARMLLARPKWSSLNALNSAIHEGGCDLSLPQTSKAVHALINDLVVTKTGRTIQRSSPLIILDRLEEAWRTQRDENKRSSLKLPAGTAFTSWLKRLPKGNWAITGVSSAQRYATMAEGGPRLIAVRDLKQAEDATGGTPEPIASFADVELMETQEDGYFFLNEIDSAGVRWASKLQAWLELMRGDARQRQVAEELYGQLAREAGQR